MIMDTELDLLSERIAEQAAHLGGYAGVATRASLDRTTRLRPARLAA
jgi:hypothetical protein